MLPLSDGVAARRFPVVNVSLIVANFAVWIFYELPHLNAAVYHASFYPCSVEGACRVPEPWGVSWITAMFLHGSWDHIMGNMLFLPSSARMSNMYSCHYATCCSTSPTSSPR